MRGVKSVTFARAGEAVNRRFPDPRHHVPPLRLRACRDRFFSHGGTLRV